MRHPRLLHPTFPVQTPQRGCGHPVFPNEVLDRGPCDTEKIVCWESQWTVSIGVNRIIDSNKRHLIYYKKQIGAMENQTTAVVLPDYEELIEQFLESQMIFPVVVNEPQNEEEPIIDENM
jgi:hypothetical protein